MADRGHLLLSSLGDGSVELRVEYDVGVFGIRLSLDELVAAADAAQASGLPRSRRLAGLPAAYPVASGRNAS